MQDLTRDNVTVASRIMLPAYVAAFAGVGLLFVFQAASRTSSTIFEVPKLLLPIQMWGLLFLAVSVSEVLALVLNRRRLFLRCLIVGSGLTTFWAVVIGSSAVQVMLPVCASAANSTERSPRPIVANSLRPHGSVGPVNGIAARIRKRTWPSARSNP